MRVLVLGGTAFIGRELVRQLDAEGHEVCVVHRGDHEPEELSHLLHVHCDRMALPEHRDEIASFAPDVVVDNLAMTKAGAESALAALPDGARLVMTSSMDVYAAYGALMDGVAAHAVPVDETSPVRAERYPYRGKMPGADDYEKLDAEDLYRARGATVLRLPMVYGPHDGQRREWFVLRRVAAGRRRIPIGSGTWLSTKGFVRDVAAGMRLAVTSDAAAGEVLNVGEPRTYPMRAWASMILEAAGSDAELVRVPDDALPPDLDLTGAVGQHLLVDSRKARELLGWTTTDPREALRESVAWHLAHPPERSDDDFSADDAALAAAGTPA